jgi:hypothetical protein
MDKEEEKAMRRGCKQKRVQIMGKKKEKAMRRGCRHACRLRIRRKRRQ